MLVLGTVLLIPLLIVEGPSVVRLSTMLMAPPAPPPPPPPAVKLVEVPAQIARSMFSGARLLAPITIPRRIAEIHDQEMPPDPGLMSTGVAGSIPGGAPDGVLGSILDQARQVVAPPKEPPKPVVRDTPVEKAPARIRVSSGVQEARLVSRVIPVYPQLAKAARISGVVKLIGIIARDGHINQLQVISGHPLLVPAAVDAVKKWVYQPTLLSGEPVEVIAPIDVNFTLSQ